SGGLEEPVAGRVVDQDPEWHDPSPDARNREVDTEVRGASETAVPDDVRDEDGLVRCRGPRRGPQKGPVRVEQIDAHRYGRSRDLREAHVGVEGRVLGEAV